MLRNARMRSESGCRTHVSSRTVMVRALLMWSVMECRRNGSVGGCGAGAYDKVELAITVHVGDLKRMVGRSARFVGHCRLESTIAVPETDAHDANVVGIPPVCNNDVRLAVGIDVRDPY